MKVQKQQKIVQNRNKVRSKKWTDIPFTGEPAVLTENGLGAVKQPVE